MKHKLPSRPLSKRSLRRPLLRKDGLQRETHAWLDAADYELSEARAIQRRPPGGDPSHRAEKAAMRLLVAAFVGHGVVPPATSRISELRCRLAKLDPSLAGRLAPLDALSTKPASRSMALGGPDDGPPREAHRTVEILESARQEVLRSLASLRLPAPLEDRLSHATIAEALAAFEGQERKRLAPSSFARYEDPFRLLRRFFISSLWFRGVYGRKRLYELLAHRSPESPPGLLYRLGPEYIVPLLPAFLDRFLPVIAAPSQALPCVRAVERFARWLAERGRELDQDQETIDTEAALEVARLASEAGEDMPDLLLACRMLEDWVPAHAPCCSERRMHGQFEITRVIGNRLWVRRAWRPRHRAGPMPIPEEVTTHLRLGWILSGTLGKRDDQWSIVKLLALFRRPIPKPDRR